MNTSVTVGLLHPGQMRAAIAAQIMTNGHTVLWCPDGRSPATTTLEAPADLGSIVRQLHLPAP